MFPLRTRCSLFFISYISLLKITGISSTHVPLHPDCPFYSERMHSAVVNALQFIGCLGAWPSDSFSICATLFTFPKLQNAHFYNKGEDPADLTELTNVLSQWHECHTWFRGKAQWMMVCCCYHCYYSAISMVGAWALQVIYFALCIGCSSSWNEQLLGGEKNNFLWILNNLETILYASRHSKILQNRFLLG